VPTIESVLGSCTRKELFSWWKHTYLLMVMVTKQALLAVFTRHAWLEAVDLRCVEQAAVI
jgi:hypothetical protein